MPIYRGTTPLKAYKGDMQPVNVYKGSTKVAGWHSASYSGASPLTIDCDYNVPPDALTIDGRCVQTGTPDPSTPAPISTITGDVIITGTDDAQPNLLPASLKANDGTVISHLNCTTMLSGDTFILTATGADAYFGGVGNHGEAYESSHGWLVPVKPSTTYTFEVFGNAHITKNFVTQYDSTKTCLGWAQLTLATRATFTTGATCDYVTVRFGYDSATSGTSYSFRVGLFEGDYTGEYKSYWSLVTNAVTVAMGSSVCASLPDGTHDSYDAVTGVLTKRVGKYVGASGTSWTISDAATSASFMSDRIPSGTMSGQTVTSSAACAPTIYYKLATPTTVQLTPHLPIVRTGIKTLSIGADVVPNLSATVKSMD